MKGQAFLRSKNAQSEGTDGICLPSACFSTANWRAFSGSTFIISHEYSIFGQHFAIDSSLYILIVIFKESVHIHILI